MSTFKYVGTMTKGNGKVDVKVGSYTFNDVTPGEYVINVPDGSREELALESASDPMNNGANLYEKQV